MFSSLLLEPVSIFIRLACQNIIFTIYAVIVKNKDFILIEFDRDC